MQPTIKQRALRRLRIIKGQVNGLEKMIGEEKYCIDIIAQSSAVRQALSGVDALLLENHLSTCAADQIKKGRSRKAIAEILKVYQLSAKK